MKERGRSRSKYAKNKAKQVEVINEPVVTSDVTADTIILDTAISQQNANPLGLDDDSSDKKKSKLPIIIILAILIIGLGGYSYYSYKYVGIFFPNSYIGSIDVSGNTSVEAIEKLENYIATYTMRLSSRYNDDILMTGSDVGLHYAELENYVSSQLSSQFPLMWPIYYFGQNSIAMPELTIDEETFASYVGSSIPALDEAIFVEAEDAKLSDYQDDAGYTVIEAHQGNSLDIAAATEIIKASLLAKSESLDLEDETYNLYEYVEVKDDDGSIQAQADALNKYVNISINYTDPEGLVLDGNTIKNWLSYDAGVVTVDEEAIKAYVATTAESINTYDKPHKLLTTWGQEVEVPAGDYGWHVDEEAESAYIIETLASASVAYITDIDHEMNYIQKAASHGENDYGDSYVEINVTAQHLYLYIDGEQVVSTDIVTGTARSKSRATPSGTYVLKALQRNRVLRGPGYASPVNYWMPFNGGIGMHDATWRSSFGGSIYLTNGSHGCINIPHNFAKEIYSYMYIGFPVIVYTLEGTESSEVYKPPRGTNTKEYFATAETATTVPAVETTAAVETTVPTEPTAETTRIYGPGAEIETTAVPSQAPPVETAPVQTVPVETLPVEPNYGPGGLGD